MFALRRLLAGALACGRLLFTGGPIFEGYYMLEDWFATGKKTAKHAGHPNIHTLLDPVFIFSTSSIFLLIFLIYLDDFWGGLSVGVILVAAVAGFSSRWRVPSKSTTPYYIKSIEWRANEQPLFFQSKSRSLVSPLPVISNNALAASYFFLALLIL